MKRKFHIVLLAILMLFSSILYVSCKSSDSAQNSLNSSDLTVWAYNCAETTKQNMSDIDEDSKVLSIELAKGESEGSQVMLTAKRDVTIKNVSVSRLENGNAYIPSSNVEIFLLDYQEILITGKGHEDFKDGDIVSDAIIPLQTSLDYGLNLDIKKGNTQAIYIEVTTPANVSAGNYKAVITLEVGNKVYEMPLEVTVWNYDISQSTMRNYWMTTARRGQFGYAELDTSDEMATYYFEKALDYRINSELPFQGIGGTSKYIELLKKYYFHPKFTNFMMYYETGANGINVSLLADYLFEIGKVSIQDKVDYLNKATIYFSNVVDEPQTSEQFDRLFRVTNQFIEAQKLAISRLDKEYLGSADYYYFNNVVKTTILSIPNIMPETLFSSIDRIQESIELTHCPLISFFETESEKFTSYINEHEYQKTIWAYTCSQPPYPYPNNFMSDYSLNFRIMSWIQNMYGISGYLNWASAQTSPTNGQNPYEASYTRRDDSALWYTECPGDGWIFYPGAPYGIKGPVGSIRAIAYRDGVEDYESLKVLEKTYSEQGLESKEALQTLYDRLFVQAIPFASRQEFDEVRRDLASMIEDAVGDCGIIYKNIIVRSNIAAVEFILTDDDAKAYYNDKELTAIDGVYTIQLDVSKDSYVQIKVVSGDEVKEYSKFVSGKYEKLNALDKSDILGIFNKNSDSTIEFNTNVQFIDAGLEGSIKVGLTGRAGAQASFYPFFAMNLSSFNIDKIANISLRVYCDNINGLSLSANTFTGVSYALIDDIELSYGWNDVVLDIRSANLSYDGKIYFRTSNLVEEGQAYTVNLYFNNLACLLKEGI